MIIPPAIATMACIWFALSQYTAGERIRFDWTGFLALSTAIIAAQLVFDRGHKLDWFESSEIIALTFIGCLALWIFAVHCMSAEKPFLNPRILLNRNFSVGITIAFVMGMLSFTAIVLLPGLLHDLRGYPDTVIGTLIAARGLGNWMAFFFIAKLTAIAPRFAIGTGLAIQATAGFWMAQVDINVTEADVFWTNFLLGLGQSVTFTPMTVMAFSTLPREQITEGSAMFTMMRNFGASLFISLSVLVLIRSTSISYSEMSLFITPYRFGLDAWSPETPIGLLRLSGEIQRQAAMIGYINAFLLSGIIAAAAVPLAFFLQRAKTQ